MQYFVREYNQPGTPPGTLETDEATGALTLHLMRFDAAQLYQDEEIDLTDIDAALAHDGIKWFDFCGEVDADILTELGKSQGLHALALEDVLHRGQRAKLDDYEQHLFLVLNLPVWKERILVIEQVNFFLLPGVVVSIHHTHPDLFRPVRERIRSSPNGRIRSVGADYVLYTLVDLVVDSAFPVLEGYAEELSELEQVVIHDPHERNLMDRIHEARRELVFFRRALWSQRDATGALLRPDNALISETSRLYLRDCHDHAIQILELAESYRDMAGALLDLQLNAMSRRMNDVMRLLTIIATIFIPLTFIAGIYGMNFDTGAGPWNMPELHWPYGYPLVLGIMAGVVAGMLILFKRRGWF